LAATDSLPTKYVSVHSAAVLQVVSETFTHLEALAANKKFTLDDLYQFHVLRW